MQMAEMTQVRECHGTEESPQIVMNDLAKAFGDFVALSNVTLRVNKGQFCCIVGPSGCGKTTLLRIMAGPEHHSSGELEIFHYDRSKPINSMIFKEHSIFPWITVRNNVASGCGCVVARDPKLTISSTTTSTR